MWSVEYGEFILCIAFVIACIAVALIAWYDHWEQVKGQYVSKRRR